MPAKIFFLVLISLFIIITGPPTHSVGASIVLLAGVCRRLSSVVVVCRRLVTHKGAVRDGGPVVLRPVRATRCLFVVS